MYRARLVADDVSAGPESLEVGLFEFDRIPWDDLAFPSVRWALHQFQESRHLDSFAAFTNPPGETSNFYVPSQLCQFWNAHPGRLFSYGTSRDRIVAV